jgi:AraC family transcriptional regulator
MLNPSDPHDRAASSPEGKAASVNDDIVIVLLTTATAVFDSDRRRAKGCVQQATELLRVGRKGHRQQRNESPHLPGGLATWQKRRLIGYIEDNIHSTLRAPELAAIVRLSCSRFFHAFRKSFGEPPLSYIKKQRVRRAQHIILNSSIPLSQIALDCGMSDQAHFTRVFRKVVGINPGAWRRQFPPAGTRPDHTLRPAISAAASRPDRTTLSLPGNAVSADGAAAQTSHSETSATTPETLFLNM